jgi:hypothetical protein
LPKIKTPSASPPAGEANSWPLAGVFCVLALSCVSGPRTSGEEVDYGFYQDGRRMRVWARGPWEAINPSTDVDEVIDQLCPAIMKLDLATLGDYGREYCGVIYRTLDSPNFYATVPSLLRNPELDSAIRKKKTCLAPSRVRDPRGQYKPEADFHSHTWSSSGMSLMDRVGPHYYFIRIQFDTLCHIQKYIPHIYDNQSGELFERSGKTWKLMGYVKDKSTGEITSAGD